MAQICYYDPQSAGINVQSAQSATTPRRLTLMARLQNSIQYSNCLFMHSKLGNAFFSVKTQPLGHRYKNPI